jgi:2'-5' RNA ligase
VVAVSLVRWVRVKNIHLTVVFLGNLSPERLKVLGEVAEAVCGQYGPFRVSLKGMGVFANKRNPRILWIGLDGDLERMSRFRDQLNVRMRPLGIKMEKRTFRPHLTLGRFRKGAKPRGDWYKLISTYEELASPACTLRELVLFRSDLHPSGAVYSRLSAWPLCGTA